MWLIQWNMWDEKLGITAVCQGNSGASSCWWGKLINHGDERDTCRCRFILNIEKCNSLSSIILMYCWECQEINHIQFKLIVCFVVKLFKVTTSLSRCLKHPFLNYFHSIWKHTSPESYYTTVIELTSNEESITSEVIPTNSIELEINPTRNIISNSSLWSIGTVN